jgi:hypothetical protein
MDTVDTLIRQLRKADEGERAKIREALIALVRGSDGAHVRELIEQAMRGELLEVQWELEEVLEATAPKKPTPAPAKPEPPPPAQPKTLSAADLTLMYDDPRGLMLYKTRVGDRWFATQVDPRSGQPQTFELHPDEVKQIKTQLQNSPYWVLGSR